MMMGRPSSFCRTLLLLPTLLLWSANSCTQVHACMSHDKACVGLHGSQGSCCDGLYCHKANPVWAEGRCYFKEAGTSAIAGATCVTFDGACTGSSGTPADCCAGTYCHKNNPSWAQGRCYHIVAAAPGGGAIAKQPCVGHDGECLGAHGTQGDCCANSYCHKGDAGWLHGRCYFSNVPLQSSQQLPAPALATGVVVVAGDSSSSSSSPSMIPPLDSRAQDEISKCVRHDGECIGDPGTQGDCCSGTYCHKDDYSWARGRCRYHPPAA